jgi:hypothetical protein
MVTFGLIQPMLLPSIDQSPGWTSTWPTSPIFKVVSDQAPAKVLETSVRTLLSRDSTTVIPSNSRLATRFTMDQESSLSPSSHKPWLTNSLILLSMVTSLIPSSTLWMPQIHSNFSCRALVVLPPSEVLHVTTLLSNSPLVKDTV